MFEKNNKNDKLTWNGIFMGNGSIFLAVISVGIFFISTLLRKFLVTESYFYDFTTFDIMAIFTMIASVRFFVQFLSEIKARKTEITTNAKKADWAERMLVAKSQKRIPIVVLAILICIILSAFMLSNCNDTYIYVVKNHVYNGSSKVSCQNLFNTYFEYPHWSGENTIFSHIVTISGKCGIGYAEFSFKTDKKRAGRRRYELIINVHSVKIGDKLLSEYDAAVFLSLLYYAYDNGYANIGDAVKSYKDEYGEGFKYSEVFDYFQRQQT